VETELVTHLNSLLFEELVDDMIEFVNLIWLILVEILHVDRNDGWNTLEKEDFYFP
jgi:hypothetical protein